MMTATQQRVPWLRDKWQLLGLIALMMTMPFIVALIDGQGFGSMIASETGSSKFVQGLVIEIVILAVFAISYDLILGVTGMLSLGHAFFFGVGAYTTGIMIRTFEWGILPTMGAVLVAALIQAMLFSMVLPRVKGIAFALVTLGLGTVLEIVVKSREASPFTGGDVGLQGVIVPGWMNPASNRLALYYIALVFLALVYFAYFRFVDSPTGRVCLAIRENEDRALMLGFNTFHFKFIMMTVASITAAYAGMLHTIYKPVVSPATAGLGYTIIALLIVLIGGIGTLSGAVIGATVFHLLEYFLDRWFGPQATTLLGVVYVLLVLFLPYGIVGTYRSKKGEWATSSRDLFRRLTGGDQQPAEPPPNAGV